MMKFSYSTSAGCKGLREVGDSKALALPLNPTFLILKHAKIGFNSFPFHLVVPVPPAFFFLHKPRKGSPSKLT